MKDFTYYAPTEVVFGANSEEKVASPGRCDIGPLPPTTA